MARREQVASGPGSRALVVDVIRSSGPVSRVELAALTGLTQPTISDIVRRLIEDGLVVERGTVVLGRGKPRSMLAIDPRSTFGIGIHLQQDSAVCVATDAVGGVIGREQVQLEAGRPIDEQLADRHDELVHLLGIDRRRVAGLAVARSGLGEDARWPSPADDLASALQQRIGVPVVVENDAAVAALGEYWSRQAHRDQPFACVYLGNGIGAGFVIDGALYRGASLGAGELGHVPVQLDGRPCWCGSRGCLERYASIAAVVEDARSGPAAGMTTPGGGADDRDFDRLARAAVAGEPEPLRLIERSADLIATAALTVANLLDVGMVVLSGPGLAVAGAVYAAAVRRRLEAASYARERHVPAVELSVQPRDAAAIGAAALVVQEAVAPGHRASVRTPRDAGRLHRVESVPFPADQLAERLP